MFRFFRPNVTFFVHRDDSEIKKLKEFIMTAFDDLNGKVDSLTGVLSSAAEGVVRVAALVADLKNQMANGVTPEQAASVGAKLDEASAAAQAVVDSLNAVS